MNQAKLVALLHGILDRLDHEQIGRQGPVFADTCRAHMRLNGILEGARHLRPVVTDEFAARLADRAAHHLPEGWTCDKPLTDGDVCNLRATFNGRGFRLQVFAKNGALMLTERARAIDTDMITDWVEDGSENAHHLKGHAA